MTPSPETAAPLRPGRPAVIATLGVTQILAWGSTYYLLAVLAPSISAETGWPAPLVVGGLTVGLLAASFVSPRVGRAVDATGGAPVLAASSLAIAAGLALLAAAQALPVYLAAWVVIGLGMGAGLYDAAFATLGRLYGREARSAITSLTLFGGFASTVCWPLSALLVEALGWRGACLAYAAIHLLGTLPAHLLLLPRSGPAPERAEVAPAAAPGADPAPSPARPRPRGLELLLAAGLTIGGIASAVVSVHLIAILQEKGAPLAVAVGLGALVGPAQVGARILEATVGRRAHPIWTAGASAALTLAGLAILALGLPILAVGLVLYGAGIGIRSIVRGTLPLALFGPGGYAALMGRLALPQLLVGALAPLGAAVLLEAAGGVALLWTLVALCALDALFVALIALAMRRRG